MNANKITVALIAGALIVLTALFIFKGEGGSAQSKNPENAENVYMSGGEQVINITVKGGYFPKVSSAKAGVPTTLRFNTKGTFDCSSAVVIPSLNYRANLSPSGITEVDVPAQEPGTKLRGTCSMGMYSFTVNFN
jgi:plastocyanin domain-containing protein